MDEARRRVTLEENGDGTCTVTMELAVGVVNTFVIPMTIDDLIGAVAGGAFAEDVGPRIVEIPSSPDGA